ncbi:LuxR C-terminal-related transcriptional regulator [Hominiventricola filiformis]|uniref:LuxR C-terminal-related transcriptional regulator n=1 Tax=Hominiventricola filiformis TaxID=2885352 RepID=A0AAE3DCQ5_9FIRM|nr:LuxR C-terminal-related transcriptional regulator [Hominiventricola filiformis]MCC2127011.1 LuxR C-terminal-related transcriptional regulator [Hominiventricola filiformis]
MSDTYIHVKPAIEVQFQKCMERGRVLFFSAPCGFGKTVTAEKLIRQTGEKYRSVSGDRVPFEQLIEDPNWKILFVDDLQMMQEEKDLQALCSLIRENPDRRFILASRGLPPGCLMAFQYTGLMSVLHADVLLFDREDIRKLFQEWEVPVTDSELSGVTKESIGHPLGVVITIRHMAEGQTFGPELVAGAFREVFRYFETAIYKRFDLNIRRFLLELAPFEQFDLDMARIVSGDPRVGEMLDWLQRNTTMLRYDETQRFHFWPQFRAFLMWEMDREYPEEKKKTLYSRGGMYYELKEDFVHAMDCYIRGGDHSKVSELLIRSAELHPGMGHYYEMEKYYHSLPEKEILASPALMQAMSMLCAMEMDYEKSEQWYEALKQFAEQCDRMDAGGRQARSRLAWLDISLPQREVSGLTDTIPAVFRLLRGKEITLPPFSVTSTLPSIMNGGKDFSDWSKKDDMLYQVLRIPVEAVLGKDGVGLADCAIAESKFEKGEDITHRMLSLVQRAGEIQRNGTPDIEFAVTGLLIRSQMASGRSDDAVRTMEQLRTRFAENGLDRFLPNMDAMRCRMDLYVGDLDRADDWYREKAPRDLMKLNVMKRYQYLTQAMVELAAGKNQDVLLTLSSLELYCRTCRRHLDSIHLLIIRAIACWREKDKTWKTYLDEALDIAEEYQFIRPVSGYGAAVLPLLEECSRDDQDKWYLRLMAAVREQAAYYPAFLQPRTAPGESLTATELQILRLICADKSNAEIGKIMDIKLPTVKTHVSHILDKLGVSRRSEAKTAAKKRWLIPDHL